MTRSGSFIGQMAARAGANPKTIRYYEAIGLLLKPQRGENRYRLYSKEVIEVLRFIRKARALGFTLSEIKEIIAIRQQGHVPCVHVQSLLKRKIAELDQWSPEPDRPSSGCGPGRNSRDHWPTILIYAGPVRIFAYFCL